LIRYAPFHDGADYFVKILEAAKKQGKYWETLDIMYRTPKSVITSRAGGMRQIPRRDRSYALLVVADL
jgi:hypothetical protein